MQEAEIEADRKQDMGHIENIESSREDIESVRT